MLQQVTNFSDVIFPRIFGTDLSTAAWNNACQIVGLQELH